ncbi:MAG: NAD-dependent epimerase/dehydratase family protein [Candidatus Eremiobacteraeota bacterium]|nr:NAD-dependent epimerase/dehydratase family protein [Candidatus Eremiobacteraeota bacterium]
MKIMVTGATGFLGGALARTLVQRGFAVRTLARSKASPLEEAGIEVYGGDLTSEEAVSEALRGCDAVCHVAAKPGVWGPYKDYYNANVKGTEHVLEGCRRHGIKKLVFTSSPSVVFSNSDQSGVTENEPYPRSFLAHYPATKAIAERMVLGAHGASLSTVSLRPHLIWGPGDRHLVPRLISRAKAGKLRIVGTGKNLVDSVYIDNAVEAHILALLKLEPASPAGGKAYFITNGEPMPLADLMNAILSAADLPPVTRKIPAGLAYAAGALMELGYGILRKKEEPLMTRFLARELACAHWFDISAARRDIGYSPAITIREGIERLREWLKNHGDN